MHLFANLNTNTDLFAKSTKVYLKFFKYSNSELYWAKLCVSKKFLSTYLEQTLIHVC